MLDELAKLGVKVRLVMGDRWFPTFDLLDALRQRGVPYLSPYKRYHVRWQIETGFRDVKRMVPESNARTNARKLLMFSARFWGFNRWQLARAEWRRQKGKAKCPRCGPTLRSFAHKLEMTVLDVQVR